MKTIAAKEAKYNFGEMMADNSPLNFSECTSFTLFSASVSIFWLK